MVQGQCLLLMDQTIPMMNEHATQQRTVIIIVASQPIFLDNESKV